MTTDDLELLLQAPGPPALLELLDAHPDLLRAEVAEQARAAAKASLLTDGPGEPAVRALVTAHVISTRLGAHDLAVHDRFRVEELRYFLTQDRPTYDALGDSLVQTAQEALSLGRVDVAAEALVVGADCSWWAASLSSGEDRAARLVRALEVVAALGTLPLAELPPGRAHQLASLVPTVASAITETLDELPTDADLRRRTLELAPVVTDTVHRLVPADLPLQAGGSPLTQQVLAARLVRWLRDLGLPVSDALLDRFSETMGETRRSLHSRLGRLFEAQELAETVAGELLAELDRSGPDPAKVFALTEVAAARTLLDGMEGLLARPADPATRELERRITSYAPSLEQDGLAREMALVSGLPLGFGEQQRRERAALVDQLEAGYVARGLGAEGEQEPAALSEVQSLLRPGEVMVRYVLPLHPLHPGYRPHALVVTRTDSVVVPLPVEDQAAGGFTGMLGIDGRAPVDSSALGQAVLMARLAAAGRATGLGADATHLSALDDLVLEPVRRTGLLDDCRHLVVVPQRALHLAPWSVLRDARGRWLIEDHAVSIAPSASVWARLRQRSGSPITRALAVGDPDATYAGLPRLPWAADEVAVLTDLWRRAGLDVTPLSGPDATYDALRAGVDGPTGAQLLHLATHGSFPTDQSLFDHALLLSQDLDHEGRVTADDLRGLDLSGVAAVVLGICDSGAYRVGPGDEPYGLVPALLEAGARTVVAAPWSVPDGPTHDLLIRVGMALPGVGGAEALRLALLDLRDGAPGDLVTALGFLCVGDGGALVGLPD